MQRNPARNVLRHPDRNTAAPIIDRAMVLKFGGGTAKNGGVARQGCQKEAAQLMPGGP